MLTPNELRAALLEDNPKARATFRERFGTELEAAEAMCLSAYKTVARLATTTLSGDREGQTVLMVHMAFNCVLSSMNHLVGGYHISSGHMMRQYLESAALAIMFADTQCPTFDNFTRLRTEFPTHKTISFLRQSGNTTRAKAHFPDLNFDGYFGGGHSSLYNHFSHAGAWAASAQFVSSQPGKDGLLIGGEYDPSREKWYLKDMKHRRDAFSLVEYLATTIREMLPLGS